MIRSVLHVCSDFGELHSIRVAAVPSMFLVKFKPDAFISAGAAEEPVTANQKAFPLIGRPERGKR